MASDIITLGNVEDALLLYHDLPSVVTFRGQTGYGFIVDWQDQEVIAPVSEAKGIWKPMYFSIRGATQARRKSITASQIVAAVETFKKNPLLAFLRTATGFGLRLDSSGAVELVSSRDAPSQVVFELSHYGGRSIVPDLTVQLGSLVSLPKWQSGFVYEAGGGKPPTSGQPLLLNRLLAEFDYASDEALERAKADLLKEADRLTLLHTDGSLSRVSYSPNGDVRVVVSQELTKLVKGLQIKHTSGFTYTIRDDDVVEVQMMLGSDALSTPEDFEGAMNAYRAECARVLTLYCNPLTPAQRQKLGKPSYQLGELPDIVEVEFKHDSERSRTEESLIAWRGRSPLFPHEGWMPEKDKTYRVFCLHWGKGFRVSPAPVEYTQRWKDNGDGTISRVEIATNHLLQQREVGVSETRPLQTRDGTATVRTERKAVLASALPADAYVEETRTRVVPIETEDVYGGTILWRQIDKREEAAGSDLYPIEKVEAFDYDWDRYHLHPDYGNANKIALSVEFLVKGNTTSLRHETTWGAVPAWLQDQLLAPYHLCSCGRKRIDPTRVTDGYGKCELCRSEEHCSRCNKQAKVTVINGHLICEDCQPYQKAEDLIDQLLSHELRRAIANEAQRLLVGQVFPKEDGEAKLRETVEHITSSWTRDSLLEKWFGYSYYYFTEEGVFGTKLSPQALERLELLPNTHGNDVVEIIAWFTGRLKDDPSNYFTRTQNHEVVALPPLEQTIRGLAWDTWRLADRLRASESERIATLEAYTKANKELSDDSSVARLLAEAWRLLQDEAQDYVQALKKVEAAVAAQTRREVLDDLLEQEEYSTCPPCGEEVDWPHVCPEQESLCATGNFQTFTLKVTRSGEVELVKLVAEYDGYRYELRLVVNQSATITEPVETELHWHQPSEQERALAEQIHQLRNRLADIAQERACAERFELTFQLGKNPKGGKQLEAIEELSGEIRSSRTETQRISFEQPTLALFIARLEENGPKPGETWICTVRHIGWRGNSPIISAYPRVQTNEQEVREKLSLLEEKLSAERKRQASFYVDQPFDQEGRANTALAEKLRGAGLI